jgi:8-oxo-dGTP pyrophosphatase MutT (NUDIX family)
VGVAAPLFLVGSKLCAEAASLGRVAASLAEMLCQCVCVSMALSAGPRTGSRAAIGGALLRRIEQVNDCSQAPPMREFRVDGEKVGAVSPEVVSALEEWPDVFDTSAASVTLSATLTNEPFEARNAVMNEVALKLRESGLITKWRDETLALVTSFNAQPSLLVERRFVPLLGGKGYGVAVNGYTRSPEGGAVYLWVGTRAANKATWPGMLDSIAAGAMSAGSSALEAARAEMAEEAGVGAELAAAAMRPVGAVSYYGVDESPILPKEDVFFVFDAVGRLQMYSHMDSAPE